MIQQTKLDIGRHNAVEHESVIPSRSLPFDTSALYCYLVERAENEFTPGTPEAICSLFETEFATPDSIPDQFITELQYRFDAAGLTDMPAQDDLKRIGAIRLFTSEYARAYAERPQGLPNPRGVTPTSNRLSTISLLPDSIRRLFARL